MPGELRFKIYRGGTPVALSDVLPMLEHMGLKVITEMPYRDRAGRRRAELDAGFLSLIVPPRRRRRGTRPRRASRRRSLRICGRAAWRTTASTASCSPPGSIGARSWCCASTPRCCARPAAPSARPIWRTRWPAIRRSRATSSRCSSALRSRARPKAARRRPGSARGRRSSARSTRCTSLDEDRILRRFLLLIAQDAAHQLLSSATPRASPKPYLSVKLRAARSSCCRCRARSVEIYV